FRLPRTYRVGYAPFLTVVVANVPAPAEGVMTSEPVLTVTYWGVTGTLSAPLRPPQVTDKLVAALRTLAERGRLAELTPGPARDARGRQLLEKELPSPQRAPTGGNPTGVGVQTPDSLLILVGGGGSRERGVAREARGGGPGPAPRRSAHVLVT